VPLHFPSTRCSDCHKDPHRGEVARFVAKGGCETCHRVESWRDIAFDHGQTKYPLVGAHARVACTPCHRRTASPGQPPELRFGGVPQACASCHRDPHQGQFAGKDGTVSCDRCHTTQSLKATKFDHSRDTRYRLDGAHARLACAACHRTETRNGATFVRYKPLPTTCRGCHGAGQVPTKGERP
jgi:hypothetical protein